MKNLDRETVIEFAVLALRRSLWTFAEVIVAMVPLGLALSEVDWKNVFEVAIVAAFIAFCKSIVAGMPEFNTDGELTISDTSCNVRLGIDQDKINSKKSIRLKVVPDINQKTA